MCSISPLPDAQLAAAVRAVADSEPGLCQRPERVSALQRSINAARGIYLRELGHVDASGELGTQGWPSTVTWLRREQGLPQRDAEDDVRLARRLRSLPVLSAAAVAGELPTRTVDLVARVLLQLPEDLIAATEPAMVDAARLMPYEQLRRFLAENVAALAPERLKEQIRSQWDRQRAHLDPLGDMNELRAMLMPLDAEVLDSTLNAIMEAQRQDGESLSLPQRRARALVALNEMALASPDMPHVRGALPHLIVVQQEGRPATTTGGNVLSDGQLDLVSCDAVITTVTVDAGRRPLDVGRSRHSLTRRLWLAVVVRDDGHCQVAGCSMPASRCVPHHIVPWRLGGRTDLDNLVLLCVAHHHALHDREIQLLLYDGRRLTPTGLAPVGSRPPPYVFAT